jgi:hypothetical protein
MKDGQGTGNLVCSSTDFISCLFSCPAYQVNFSAIPRVNHCTCAHNFGNTDDDDDDDDDKN